MTDMSHPAGFPDEKKQLPSGLNVLTILTLVGSAIVLLMSLWQFARAKKGIEDMEKMINSENFDDMPGFVKSMMSPEMLEMARKQYENRVPILLITLVALGLCIFGAIQMRQLKKQGYFLYLIGELLPLVSVFLFIGVGALKGLGALTVVIPIIFITLYTMQRKHLRN